MTTPIELLRKLKALSEQGVGGEKINATKILRALMSKHGVTNEQLSEEQRHEYFFPYDTAWHHTLLVQTIYKVTNSTTMYIVRRYKKITCQCTKAQRIEIEFLYDFYKRVYAKDIELVNAAFIQKHRIFGELADGEKAEELSYEEYMRLSQMMSTLCNDSPQQQLQRARA